MAANPVDAAIAAVEEPQSIEMRQFQVTIASTGRPAVLVLPADASDAEIDEVCAWMLTSVMASYRTQRAGPRSHLVIARGLPPAP